MMKIFLFFISLMMTIFLFWKVGYTSSLMRMYPNDIVRWNYKLSLVRDKKLDFETIVVGDSATDSVIVPRVQNKKILNLGLGGGTPADGYYFFKEYLKNHHAPKNFVISYTPISVQSKSEFRTHALSFGEIDFIELFTLDNKYKNAEDLCIDDYDLPLWLINILPKSIVFNWELVSFYLGLSKSQLEYVHNIFKKQVYRVNLRKQKELLDNPNTHIDVPFKANYIRSQALPPEFKMNNLFRIYFEKLITLGLSSGSRVFVINPPHSSVYLDYWKEPSWIKYREYYKTLQGVYPSVKVKQDLIVYDKVYFEDSFHVTEEGAAKFSRELFEYIK